MPKLGRDPNYSYIDLHYKVGWEPLKERAWASRFIREDGTEDMQGFEAEFSQRYPELFRNGSTAYLPKSVDYYLRHDAKGSRLDIDWELARMPTSDDERELMRQIKQKELRQKRKEALEARLADVGEEEEVPETIKKSMDFLEEIEGTQEAG